MQHTTGNNPYGWPFTPCIQCGDPTTDEGGICVHCHRKHAMVALDDPILGSSKKTY